MDTLPDTTYALDSKAIARRLRRHMGEIKLSRSRLAVATGIGRTALGTKLDGDVEFTIGEIAAIAAALDQRWDWVLAGDEPTVPHSHARSRKTVPTGRGVVNKPVGWLSVA